MNKPLKYISNKECMDIPKIVARNHKSARDKEVEKIAKICDLMGRRSALIDIQTDIWEKIEEIKK